MTDAIRAAALGLDPDLPAGGLPAPVAKPQRPTRRYRYFNQELAEQLCEEIADSTEPVQDICKRLGIPRCNMYRWMLENVPFHHAYNVAMACRAHSLFDDCLKIVDDDTQDFVTTKETGDDGVEVETVELNRKSLVRAQMQLTERHYLIAKLLPRRFGQEAEGLPDPMAQGPANENQGAAEIEESPICVAIRQYEEDLAAGKIPGLTR